jgi:hypothetical protein
MTKECTNADFGFGNGFVIRAWSFVIPREGFGVVFCGGSDYALSEVMSAKHIGLGRGLGALIKDTPTPEPVEAAPPVPAAAGGITRIPIEKIHKSPWQPRQHIAPEELEDLTHSVRERGVLQPLLVRTVEDHYE